MHISPAAKYLGTFILISVFSFAEGRLTASHDAALTADTQQRRAVVDSRLDVLADQQHHQDVIVSDMRAKIDLMYQIMLRIDSKVSGGSINSGDQATR